MKRRAKAVEDWDTVVEVPSKIEEIVDPQTQKKTVKVVPQFQKEDYKPILQLLGISPTEKNLRDIIQAQIYYYTQLRAMHEGPTMPQICAAMEKLIKYGKKYASCLQHLDYKSGSVNVIV